MGYGSHGSQDASLDRFNSHEAYDLLISKQNDKAVQVVAGQAVGLEDCRELLAMLGLDAQASRVEAG